MLMMLFLEFFILKKSITKYFYKLLSLLNYLRCFHYAITYVFHYKLTTTTPTYS